MYLDYGFNERLTFLDIEGNIVKRNPYTNPYNYDEYVIWKKGCKIDRSTAVYSDRLQQWDSEKFNKCKSKINGEFSYDNPKTVETFLSLYFEQEIELTAIVQGCNQSSGFPYWVFYYKEENHE